MLKWFALKVLNIQFRPDLMKWFALKSLNINFVHICHRWHHHYFLLETDFDRQDPKNFLNAAKVHKIPDQHFSRIRDWKGPLDSVEPPKEHPPGLIDLFIPHISLLPSQQGGNSDGKSNWSKLHHLQPNHQASQVFPKIWLPASLENLRSSPPLCNAQRFKVVSESLSTGPNWSHFLSLLIPNNYKSEMH